MTSALQLPRDLKEALPRQRWFAGKARRIEDVRVIDRAGWADDSELWLAEVTYADNGQPEAYLLVETVGGPERLDHADLPGAVLTQFLARATRPTAEGGSLSFRPTTALGTISFQQTFPRQLLTTEQSNSSIRFGDALIFKLFRRVQMGDNPEVEIGRFLTERTSFTGTPAVTGSLEYCSAGGDTASLGLLQAFVPNHGDAWSRTLARLRRALDDGDLQPAVAPIEQLGIVTAQLHLALASDASDPAFAPDRIDAHDVAAWAEVLRGELASTTAALAQAGIHAETARLLTRAGGLAALTGSAKTRHHGDYHLGQVLERTAGGFSIIDFEGEPSRPLAARREKRSPLRDVAGMLRSLDYARHAALRASDTSRRERGRPGGEQAAANPARPAAERTAERTRLADQWHAQAREAFLSSYVGTVSASAPDLLPEPERVQDALAALELEKAAYEVRYELGHRPDWLPIPLATLQLP